MHMSSQELTDTSIPLWFGDCPVCRAFFMHTDRERNVVTKRSEGWTLVIARLCRAFFMHFQVRLRSSKFQANDCPVMSGFFHAHLKNGENVSRPKVNKKMIARLCRAFFMHCSIFNHYRSA